MSLWLPKWLRQDTPPDPENVHRRYFIFAGAATAAAALLPAPPLGPLDTFSAQQLLNERNPLAGLLERDAYAAYYRVRMLHATVRLDRRAILESVHEAGTFRAVAIEETGKALAEVYAEAARNGIELVRTDPSYYADRVEEAAMRHLQAGHGALGRDVTVPIAVHEVGRWVDADGKVLREVSVPTRDLVPRVRIVDGKEDV